MAMNPGTIDAIHIILGILGTISLFMVNSVTQAQLNGDTGYSGGCMEARGARIWIFIGFVLGFAAIIAAVWVMVASFTTADGKKILMNFIMVSGIYSPLFSKYTQIQRLVIGRASVCYCRMCLYFCRHWYTNLVDQRTCGISCVAEIFFLALNVFGLIKFATHCNGSNTYLSVYNLVL